MIPKFFKNLAGDKSNENRYVDRSEDAEKINRREFLKKAGRRTVGAVGLGMALKRDSIESLINILGREEHQPTEEEEDLSVNQTESYQEKVEEAYEELEKNAEEVLSTREIFDFDKDGEVKIGPSEIEGIKNYWKKLHAKPDSKLNRSLKSAYYEIGAFENDLKKIFTEEGVPEKFIYLAIPESYWQLEAVSPVGAKGPYQFMKTTASKYGLYSDKNRYDYRTDPIKSARAAAKLLSDLYAVSGDWDLALSGYNGGHIWRYLSSARDKQEKPSYENFLSYLEGKINNIKNETKYSDSFDHVIRSPLSSIARRYGVSVDQIVRLNNIDNPNKVQRGQIIKIPLLDKKQRERVYYRKIAGFRENLNYPAKFNGIYEAIEEGVVSKQKPNEDHTVYITKNTYPKTKEVNKQENKKYITYTVSKGEGWFRVHQNVKHLTEASQKDIIKANPEIAKRGLRLGDELIIPKKKDS